MNLTIVSDLKQFCLVWLIGVAGLLIHGSVFAQSDDNSPSVLAAVATTKVALSSTTWTDLGVGPAIVGPSGQVVMAIGDVTPTIPVQQGFTFQSTGGVQCFNTPSHVWAMAATPYSASVFVAGVAGC